MSFEHMSFLEKILLGLIGAELIGNAESLHKQHRQEREQRRHDSLFWQEAERRTSNAYGEGDDEDDWL